MSVTNSQNNLNLKTGILIFSISLIIRSLAFFFYVQHEERYCQPDSPDYHIYAASITYGIGLYRPDNLQPLFWRTPGYPLYLSLFYNIFGLRSFNFSDNSYAQKASIWIQIIICSILPILIYYLALIITNSYLAALISAIISIFHLGFILSSTYLLTDALALIFFITFLIFFYKSFKNINNQKIDYLIIFISAFFLAIFTWIRPMGQFIALTCAIILFLASTSFRNKIKIILLFIISFFLLISPWYIRNYNLTRKVFFCPIFGPYLTVFCAPKIKSKIENIPLKESHRILSLEGGKAEEQAIIESKKNNSCIAVCRELASVKVALPIVLSHPLIFIKDWITEVIKTIFDLYSSQLVAFACNSFKWDPLIEYLPEKIASCLYKQDMPVSMRLISWLEFIFSILLWLGFIYGSIIFLIKNIINWSKIDKTEKPKTKLWLISYLIILISVGLTGGFGYARLRLPIEPLLIILSVQAWLYLIKKLIVFRK